MDSLELLKHLEKLRNFAVVAQMGGFHKASRELGVSQPGLSRSIDALESVIKNKLLIRSVKGVRLTEEGEMILALYEKIESSVNDLGQKINSGNIPFSGELRIASYETLSSYLWPQFLKHFEKLYPQLKITLITRDEKEHWNKLVSGSIDVIVDAEPKVSNQWDSHVLYTDVFNFFVAKNYKMKDDAIDLIYVDKAYDQDGLTIRDHCIQHKIKFKENYKLDTFLSVKSFALNGLGVAVLPERLVQLDVEQVQLKRFPVKGFPAKGFGKHRICFSIPPSSKIDARILLLKKEMRSFLVE